MQREIRDGLILRSLSEGVESDQTGLPLFYQDVFGEDGDPDAERLNWWAQDLINTDHPTVTLDDIWVVVDPAKDDAIVSALLLIPQTWQYEDIQFGCGRVELVATHKDYRRRGLIRELMNAAHERSTSLGHLVQGITGIPHYYRRFGYGMSADLGARAGMALSIIQPLDEGESVKFTLRPAGEGDIPALVAWSAAYALENQVSVVWDEAMLRYEITVRNPEAVNAPRIYMIVNPDDEPVGYVLVRLWENNAALMGYVVSKQSSYLDTFSDVMRGLRHIIDSMDLPPKFQPGHIRFGDLHPMIDVMVRKTFPSAVTPYTYAWYIRIPDVGAFLRHVAPVLERRLEGSAAHGYTGTLTVDFYDFTGLILTFEKGKLLNAEHRILGADDKPDAAFPFYSFFDLIFGRRTTLELGYIMPDVIAVLKAHILLDTLFPKGHSWLMALT